MVVKQKPTKKKYSYNSIAANTDAAYCFSRKLVKEIKKKTKTPARSAAVMGRTARGDVWEMDEKKKPYPFDIVVSVRRACIDGPSHTGNVRILLTTE